MILATAGFQSEELHEQGWLVACATCQHGAGAAGAVGDRATVWHGHCSSGRRSHGRFGTLAGTRFGASKERVVA